MPRMRVVSGKRLVTVFESFGFVAVSQKGSHIKMHRRRLGNTEVLVVPNHTTIAKGTLKTIFTQASEFIPASELNPFFYN